ncbi:hypothetical protein NDU88_011718 [Pleurodeles waltl]|uniref:Uncharacterized protein n=1 Tax=Pleurodeles waltl TaxID=8319 RepID=A0AAV7S7N9_PLEWA|nr:hypothetical protein NDU88_011718 [Pleurodeles waltl]
MLSRGPPQPERSDQLGALRFMFLTAGCAAPLLSCISSHKAPKSALGLSEQYPDDDQYGAYDAGQYDQHMEERLVEALDFHIQDSVNKALVKALRPFAQPIFNFGGRCFGAGSGDPTLAEFNINEAGRSSSYDPLEQSINAILNDHEYEAFKNHSKTSSCLWCKAQVAMFLHLALRYPLVGSLWESVAWWVATIFGAELVLDLVVCRLGDIKKHKGRTMEFKFLCLLLLLPKRRVTITWMGQGGPSLDIWMWYEDKWAVAEEVQLWKCRRDDKVEDDLQAWGALSSTSVGQEEGSKGVYSEDEVLASPDAGAVTPEIP